MRLRDVELVGESGTVIPVTDILVEDVAWPFGDRMGRPVTARTPSSVHGRRWTKMTIQRPGGEQLGTFILTGVSPSLDQGVRSIIYGIQLSD